MIRAVLFDMDGLMFDTERLATETWMELGRRHGIPVTRELMDETRGRPLEDCVRIFKKHLGQDFDFFKHRGERKRYMDAYLEEHGLPVKPGLGRLLGYLRENGYKTALATSTHAETAGAYLKIAGVEEYFDCKVFGDMVERGKPNPDRYLRAAKLLGIPPEECLVLEDSPCGVCAGWRAGCRVIMIPDLVEPSGEDLERADACVPSLNEVISYLEN